MKTRGGVGILGAGSYVPEKVLTNEELKNSFPSPLSRYSTSPASGCAISPRKGRQPPTWRSRRP